MGIKFLVPEIDIRLDANSCSDTPLWLLEGLSRMNITNKKGLLAQEQNELEHLLASYDN